MSLSAFADLPERYRIIRSLGSGTEKKIYLAEDRTLDRLVAIAVVEQTASLDPNLDCLREVRAMARVGESAHIVSIHDCVETSERVFIVSQYLSGGNLADVLKDVGAEPLSLQRALRIGIQLCQALEAVHGNGIVHLDLKPENVLLSERGDALLGDFGFAMRQQELVAHSPEPLGTPPYMAPELLTRSAAGTESDLYSLGCVLYELTTGLLPFSAASATETLRLHQHGTPRAPNSIRTSLPNVLSDLLLSLLQRHPVDRPRNASDVRAALQGIQTAATRQTRLHAHEDGANVRGSTIGREAEAVRLRKVLDRGCAGHAGIAVLEGEAGAGKSHLLDELRTWAEAQGAAVLEGRGQPDRTVPYGPIREALRPLAGRLGELPEEEAARLAVFLYGPQSHRLAATEQSADADRHQLFTDLAGALRILSRSRPLVLCFDDLQWSDSASLDLLEHLALSALSLGDSEFHLAVIAATRPAPEARRLGQLLSRLGSAQSVERVELGGLSMDGLYQFVTAQGVRRPSDQLLRAIAEVTGGNPLFVRELLHHLDRQGALQEQRGFTVSTIAATNVGIPASITAAMEVRFGERSESCRRTLRAAALLGSRFSASLLARVVERGREAVLADLAEATEHDLLLQEGESHLFAHPLVHQVFLRMTGPARARSVHVRIATELEAMFSSAAERPVNELAHHLLAAGEEAEAGKVIDYTRKAAGEAIAQFAWAEAAELLSALTASRHLGAQLDPSARAEVHRQLGYCYYNCADVGPCLHHLGLSIDVFRQLKDEVGEARALTDRALATSQFGLIAPGNLEEIDALRRSSESLGNEHRALKARVLGTLSELYFASGDQTAAYERAIEGMRIALEEGDHRLCAQICRKIALAEFQAVRVHAAFLHYEKGTQHAEQAGDSLEWDRCNQRIPIVLYMAGRLSEAARKAENSLDVTQGDALFSPATMTGIHAVQGNPELAEHHALLGFERLKRVKQVYAAMLIPPALACSRALRDDTKGARRAMARMLEPGLIFDDPRPIEPLTRPFQHLIDAYAGERLTDGHLALELPVAGDAEEAMSLAALTGLCAQVECAYLAQAGPIPQFAQDMLAVAAERGVVFTPGWPFLVPRIRAIAAASVGNFGESAALFESAIDTATEVAALPELGRARLDYATMLLSRQAEGDLDHAELLSRQAAGDLRRFGARRFAEQAEKLAMYLADSVQTRPTTEAE